MQLAGELLFLDDALLVVPVVVVFEVKIMMRDEKVRFPREFNKNKNRGNRKCFVSVSRREKVVSPSLPIHLFVPSQNPLSVPTVLLHNRRDEVRHHGTGLSYQ